jgi:hypothetical protein
MPNYDAANPLILGTALHKGIESGLEAMQHEYYDHFPVRTDDQENEMIKLEILLPKVQKFLERFAGCKIEHEVKISTEHFLGFADLIVTAPDGTSLVIDFKYSNSVEKYLESGQPHLYEYFLNQLGRKVTGIGFLFIPKTSIRQKQSEGLYEFRQRLRETVSKMEVNFQTLQYDEMNVIYFQNAVREIETALTAWRTAPKGDEMWADDAIKTLFPKNPDGECFACNPRFAPEYLNAEQHEVYNGKQKEIVIMPIPTNERREKKTDLMPDTWLYGDSYVGKSVFWDSFPNVLMLNTDGNTDNTTSPVDMLKDKVTMEGRMEKRRYAWEQFLGDVKELELGNNNGFKTVVIDLVEDLYESCRQFVLNKNGWEHETDGAYGKGWSAVRDEFHSAIKRLKAVGLQIVYISREDRKDVTLKNGINRTTFQPNIDAKSANFLTGTVDITMRAYVNDDDQHVLQLQKAPNVFGGGRYVFKAAEVPLERDEFLEALKDAQPVTKTNRAISAHKSKEKSEQKSVATEEPTPEPEQSVTQAPAETAPEPNTEKPKRRTRKSRKVEPAAEEPVAEDPVMKRAEEITPPGEKVDEVQIEQAKKELAAEDAPAAEEPAKPTRRRRRRRTQEEA